MINVISSARNFRAAIAAVLYFCTELANAEVYGRQTYDSEVGFFTVLLFIFGCMAPLAFIFDRGTKVWQKALFGSITGISLWLLIHYPVEIEYFGIGALALYMFFKFLQGEKSSYQKQNQLTKNAEEANFPRLSAKIDCFNETGLVYCPFCNEQFTTLNLKKRIYTCRHCQSKWEQIF